jgi:hypothetical protein
LFKWPLFKWPLKVLYYLTWKHFSFDHNLLLYAYEMLYAGECAGVLCCWWRSVLVCFACVICLWDAVKCGWIIWVACFSRSVDSLLFWLRNGHS